MTKIMLVEDDKSLREIYGVRLLAEGYDIVSAGDGEEALAMAIKERPQLILSDVMMPKISGFDMLDILRSTTETRNIKVIMMTALSSEEQRLRGEQLGADRYLVKSQVGIEDVVRTVHEVLEDRQAAASPSPVPTQTAPRQITPVTPPARAPQPTAAPVNPAPSPVASSQDNVPKPPSARSRIIQPLNDPSVATVDLNDLLDKELAKEAGIDGSIPAPVVSTTDEQGIVSAQLDNFAANLTATQSSSVDNVPPITISDNGTVAQPADTTSTTPAPASTSVGQPEVTAPQPVTPAPASPPAPVIPQPTAPATAPIQPSTMPQPTTVPVAEPTVASEPAAPPLVVPERPAPAPVAPPPSFPPAA